MINKVNDLTSRIVESGFMDFLSSFGQFLANVRGMDAMNNGTDYSNCVSMKQFYFPLMIYLISMMISIIVLILEIIYYNFQKNRQLFPYVE